jgi:hypothetical protein
MGEKGLTLLGVVGVFKPFADQTQRVIRDDAVPRSC